MAKFTDHVVKPSGTHATKNEGSLYLKTDRTATDSGSKNIVVEPVKSRFYIHVNQPTCYITARKPTNPIAVESGAERQPKATTFDELHVSIESFMTYPVCGQLWSGTSCCCFDASANSLRYIACNLLQNPGSPCEVKGKIYL